MNVEEALEQAFDAYDKHAPWRGQQIADFLASLRANGFEIVPRKATEKMMRSACEIDCGLEVCDDAGKCAHDTRWQLYAETWRYMLTAAQEIDDGR